MPQHSISLEKTDPRELFGPQDQHLRLLEQRFPETKITARGQVLKLEGPSAQIESLATIFQEMMSMIRRNINITKQDVQTLMAVAGFTGSVQSANTDSDGYSDIAEMSGKSSTNGKKVKTASGPVSGLSEPDLDKTFFPDETSLTGNVLSKNVTKSAPDISSSIPTFYPNGELILHTHAGEPVLAKTPGQREIVKASAQNDIVFAIGPAGTGKTFTSVALAVAALKTKQVKKIILARPAVEAGESLGFLPGALKEKIDPYLRPLYDALEEMIDHDRLEFNLARNIIEIAPLAYMRGRTLNNAFVILDEAQNATHTQMKMFLTRIGFHSRAIITGDITQTDLPKSSKSGLISIQNILQNIPGIEFVHLGKEDVVRHRLVRDIIKAYEDFEEKEPS
jgi:phosphate starvation-inducible PhoH-like protein